MELTAQINKVNLPADLTDTHKTAIEFSLWDGESTQMVSFESTIDLAQASFLVEHTQLGTDNSAYAQMLRAFCTVDDTGSLVDRIFTSGEHEADCENGTHSWVDKVGLLPPDTKCDHCDETYGHPA